MPNPLLQISESEVERLSDIQFVDIMNKLIKAETQLYGISPLCIKTTLGINHPDEGVDAEVKHSVDLPNQCRIPTGLSVWQFKSGEISPSEIRDIESKKVGILNAIEAGGSYCFAIGHVYTGKPRKNRELAVNENYRDKESNANGILFTAQDIADWISDYPVVAMEPYFSRPFHDELLTFDQWDDLPALRSKFLPFVSDESRTRLIQTIGQSFRNRNGFSSIRVTGKAGIGKTRLCLEAIRENDLSLNTIYAQSRESIPDTLISFLESKSNIRIILVVDETDYPEANELVQLCSRCGDRLFLITIGHDYFSTAIQSEIPNFILEPLNDEKIREIIRLFSPTIRTDIQSFIIRASGGYVKLATALTDAISRNPNLIGAADLVGSPDIELVLKSLVPDKDDLKVLEALSILTKVGLDNDVEAEGIKLADFFRIDFKQLKRITAQIAERGLIVKKGRYRYITPYILAIWLASKVWKDLSSEIISELLLSEDGLPLSAKESLLMRLAEIGDEEISAPIADQILRNTELFNNFDNLNNPVLARIFSTLAEANPNSAARSLYQILSPLPRDNLLELKTGRQQIVLVLKKLLRWEETFWISARLLLKLAEAENEEYANNATGVWCGIFNTVISDSPFPANDRHILISEALASDKQETRLIAVQALSHALSVYETGDFEITPTGFFPPKRWKPKMWGEIWEARRSALEILDTALIDANPEVANAARTVLMDSAQGLVQQKLFDDIFPRLIELPIRTEKEKNELWALLRRIIHFEGDILSEDQKSHINNYLSELSTDTYHDRLRRWVGGISPVDILELDELGKKPEEFIVGLAEEGIENPSLLNVELDWLGSEDSMYLLPFMIRVGELDEDFYWLGRFMDLVKKGRNPVLVSGYLVGHKNNGRINSLYGLLDEWIQNENKMAEAIIDIVWRIGGSNKGIEYIRKLIKNDWLPISQYGVLGYGRWTEPLSPAEMIELLSILSQDETTVATEICIPLLFGRLRIFPGESAIYDEIAVELLTRDIPGHYRGMYDWYWGKLSEIYINGNECEFAKDIITNLYEHEFSKSSRDPKMKILRIALTNNPSVVWPMIGNQLLRKDKVGISLRFIMREWGIENAGNDILIEWAKENIPRGPCILAELAVVLSTLARRLLIEFEEYDCVRNALIATYLSGSFWGSEVQWLDTKRNNVTKWLNDNDTHIRSWAQELVANIEERISITRQREEEELL